MLGMLLQFLNASEPISRDGQRGPDLEHHKLPPVQPGQDRRSGQSTRQGLTQAGQRQGLPARGHNTNNPGGPSRPYRWPQTNDAPQGAPLKRKISTMPT